MKKTKIGVLLLVLSLAAGGCGEKPITMTQDEEAMIVAYAAHVVSKFNTRQPDGLSHVPIAVYEKKTMGETEQPEEPEEEEPEESEEPVQEEPKEESNAGTELLALLQEERNNGFVEGESPKHTYFSLSRWEEVCPFIYKDVVYLVVEPVHDVDRYPFHSYNIASKELLEAASPHVTSGLPGYFMDGNFYFMGCYFEGSFSSPSSMDSRMFDSNGTVLNSNDSLEGHYGTFFEKGILAINYYGDSVILLSHNFERIAEIPAPQLEIEHGLKKDVKINRDYTFAANGTIYTRVHDNGSWRLYRLNTDTYEWDDMGDVPEFYATYSFYGKYVARKDGIYDFATGEQVFEYGELYPAASNSLNMCYFGGDKYLGKKGDEYRWVNLTDLTMSDPLPFPEGKNITILNDTYCIYKDNYGWFLWNYNTGEEETIVMFEQ